MTANSDELLEKLFNAAPLPMMLCSFPEGIVLRSNTRANELFLAGRSIKVGTIIGDNVWSAFSNQLRGGGFIDDYEALLNTAYGESFYGVLSGQLINVGDKKCILIGASDITDRKHAEETMLRFFDGAPMVMILARICDGMILRVNRRASELFDPSDADNTRYLDGIMGLVAKTIFIDRLGGGGFLDNFEAELTTAYGEKFWANLSGQVMEIDEVRSVLIGVSDISDRKRAEDELRAAKDEAERATKSKSLFLATMSHEIRTPMNGVLGMLDLLSTTPLTVEQDEMVRVIGDSASTLLTIIDDILDVSKIEAGKMNLERVSTKLSELLEGTLDLVAARARDKDIEMAWLLDSNIPEFIFGDPVRLRQILLNLLGNAVKFTQQGHVALKASLTGQDGDFISVRFEVEDSGIGLTDEQQARLFQPFSQADDSTTRRFGGTGLGLSICRRLVSMMGGNIGVISRESFGSTFWFEIPLETAPQNQTAVTDFAGITVLVINDAQITRLCISGILHRHGAQTVQVESLDDLKRILAEPTRFDIVLIDEKLQTSATLSALLHRVNPTRIISLTRSTVPNDDIYKLSKPIHSNHMLRMLNVVLGRLSGLDEMAAPRSQDALPPPSIQQAQEEGRLILVAEDNRTNQLVIGKQLTRLGYAFEIVNDGEEAWDALQHKNYGLLLTDCFMPRLDGYLLTGRIRQHEAQCGTSPHLPIVALTASALRDDADKCLRAGMDDYLSKPIAIERLRKTMDKWMPQAKQTEGVAPPPPSQSDAGPCPVDLAKLTEILGDDDPALHAEILGFFIECFDELQQKINIALGSENRIELRNAAHAAKGAAQNAGTTLLGATLYTLEHQALDGEMPDLRLLSEQIKDQFAAVQSFVSTLPATTTPKGLP